MCCPGLFGLSKVKNDQSKWAPTFIELRQLVSALTREAHMLQSTPWVRQHAKSATNSVKHGVSMPLRSLDNLNFLKFKL